MFFLYYPGKGRLRSRLEAEKVRGTKELIIFPYRKIMLPELMRSLKKTALDGTHTQTHTLTVRQHPDITN